MVKSFILFYIILPRLLKSLYNPFEAAEMGWDTAMGSHLVRRWEGDAALDVASVGGGCGGKGSVWTLSGPGLACLAP